jgi:gamma-glutamyl hercynylcysteine S-oxide synthase
VVCRAAAAPNNLSQERRKDELREALESTRKKTLWLLEHVQEDFLKVRVHSFYSPIGWHFGHIGRTEEYWVLHKAFGRPVHDDALSFLFADLPENPKDNRVNLPERHQIVEYLGLTRERTLEALEGADLDDGCPFFADGYAWEFAIQHECQHQETICEMLQLIQKALGEVPAGPYRGLQLDTESQMLLIPGGDFLMGSADRHGYDNEKMPHKVEVKPFYLDRCPVTAEDWSLFIRDGGYECREFWSAEGWEWCQSANITEPEYWVDTGRTFAYRGPMGLRDIDPYEPICGISWYEADAYARWDEKRLPTEVEWEYAASHTPKGKRIYPWGNEEPTPNHASFGINRWDPGPVGQRPDGASFFGIHDMAGGVWEWTSTPFLPYPGFEAFPYDGYSKDHMDGKHFVCRGGSWATAAPILRCTFRNWYVPTYRQGFLGLRCAR